MIIDGKAIAQAILTEVAESVAVLPRPPRLTVFTCAPNFETEKFLTLKKKRAKEAGIVVTLVTLDSNSDTAGVVAAIASSIPQADGIVVQLPFPPHIDTAVILAAVPASHDVDVLRYQGEITNILPPVVGAIDAIVQHHDIELRDKLVVIVGQGRLVGQPAALYLKTAGSAVTILEKDTVGAATTIAGADILVLGAGVPNLITSAIVKPGVVIFDAGTSEEGGVLVGDAAAEVAEVASLFTPVPGGIGPITIAILLRNLLHLQARQ